jgi:hypothetical protein
MAEILRIPSVSGEVLMSGRLHMQAAQVVIAQHGEVYNTIVYME